MKAEQIREWLLFSPPPNPEHDQTLGWINEAVARLVSDWTDNLT